MLNYQRVPLVSTEGFFPIDSTRFCFHALVSGCVISSRTPVKYDQHMLEFLEVRKFETDPNSVIMNEDD